MNYELLIFLQLISKQCEVNMKNIGIITDRMFIVNKHCRIYITAVEYSASKKWAILVWS